MSRYQMSDGTVVDTKNATASWGESTRWDGHNHISVATGSQWEHQTLYRSRKGRYYVEHTSRRDGSTPGAEWVSLEEACRWLLANEHSPEDENFPEDLKDHIDKVSE
jgi:hypothetical protein